MYKVLQSYKHFIISQIMEFNNITAHEMCVAGHEARKLEATLDRPWWAKCKKFQC